MLFHRVIADIASQFRLDGRYFVEWAPWVLLVLGLAFLLPVAYSSGLDPDSRQVGVTTARPPHLPTSSAQICPADSATDTDGRFR